MPECPLFSPGQPLLKRIDILPSPTNSFSEFAMRWRQAGAAVWEIAGRIGNRRFGNFRVGEETADAVWLPSHCRGATYSRSSVSQRETERHYVYP